MTWRFVVAVSTTLLLLSSPPSVVGQRFPHTDSGTGSSPPDTIDTIGATQTGHSLSRSATRLGIWGAASISPGRVLGKIAQNQLRLIGLRLHHRLIPTSPSRRAPETGPTLTYTADLVPFASVSIPEGTAPGGVSAIQSVRETGLNAWGLGIYPLGLRVGIRPSATLRPFIAGHTGLFYFSNPVPDERGRQMNFAAGMGGGVRISLSRDTILILGYRYHHLSNGFRGSINPGLDANLLYLGLTLAP